jgi:hypothetical protein
MHLPLPLPLSILLCFVPIAIRAWHCPSSSPNEKNWLPACCGEIHDVASSTPFGSGLGFEGELRRRSGRSERGSVRDSIVRAELREFVGVDCTRVLFPSHLPISKIPTSDCQLSLCACISRMIIVFVLLNDVKWWR